MTDILPIEEDATLLFIEIRINPDLPEATVRGIGKIGSKCAPLYSSEVYRDGLTFLEIQDSLAMHILQIVVSLSDRLVSVQNANLLSLRITEYWMLA